MDRFTESQWARIRDVRESLEVLADIATEQADLLADPPEEYDFVALVREMTDVRARLAQALWVYIPLSELVIESARTSHQSTATAANEMRVLSVAEVTADVTATPGARTDD